MAGPIVYTKAASADLREIARYTLAQWGEAQARSYIAQIEQAAVALADGNGVFKDLSALHPGMQSTKVGSHFVFCVVRPGQPALVLAILHERMDLMVRLRARLQPH
jgi:plasmid stabilization system protein ParE